MKIKVLKNVLIALILIQFYIWLYMFILYMCACMSIHRWVFG